MDPNTPPPPPGFQPMDQSASTPSAPPPPPGFQPVGSSAPTQTPAAPQQSGAITDNPKGEGVYHMKSSDGRDVQIPYSKVWDAASNGYLFSDKDQLQRYARDHAEDPVDEDQVNRYLDAQPWWHPARLTRDLLAGAGGAALKTATAFDKTPTTRGETALQLAAATPPKGAAQAIGDLGENAGEFVMGGELSKLVGLRAVGAAKYKAVSQALQMLEQNPALAKVMRIGLTAVKNPHVEAGTIAGAQTYAKTHDPTAAAESAGVTALTGQALDKATSAVANLRKMPTPTTPAAEEYARQARAAAEPHLQAISDLIEHSRAQGSAAEAAAGAHPGVAPAAGAHAEIGPGGEIEAASGSGGNPGSAAQPGAQPGGATGRPAQLGAGEAAQAAPKALDVNRILDTIHDFTGAADRLTQVNDASYSAIDKMTAGKFRPLNAEVQAAQSKIYKTEPGTPAREAAEAIYKNKKAEMDDLLDSVKGLPKGTVPAVKASWRQSYLLRDFGDMWDRNVNGIPGASQVSNEERGINGKGLMKDLQRAVRNEGRATVESSLGPGRLENLERIARLNQTKDQRAAFNGGIREVVRDMAHAGMLGGLAAHAVGGEWAMGAGTGAGIMAAAPLIQKVLNAVKSNPKIGGYLTSAIEMGARPEVYGPMISRMIQENHDNTAREQADFENEQGGSNENQ